MKLAFHQITSGSGRDLEQTFKAYAAAGWRHFEINFWEVGSFIEQNGIEAVVDLMKANGLGCVGATGLSITAFEGEEKLEADLKQMDRLGAYMAALGCGAIVCGGGTPPDFHPRAATATEEALSKRDAEYREAMGVYASAARRVAEVAAAHGVRLALEVNWVGLARSIRSMAELVEMVDRDNVGAVWDPAHFYSTPSRVEDLDLLKGKIFHAHLNDIRGCPPEVMDINGDRVIPGEGVLPLREWSDKVAECGYDGYHCLELFSQDVWALPVEEIAKKARAGCDAVWPDATY